MGLNLAVTAAYAAGFAWRQGGGYPEGQGVWYGQLALSVVALAGLSLSGHLGGKLAYRYGVRVAEESVQAEGYRHRHRC
ncbi:DUF2231 domain-containing protein [Streptomyces sp. CG1]|uniref:DUF2231 domain-containing protein n=1 Tax=Streptomyces sp. CG1 TaxID=1287523 RepID=UPI0034E1F907